MQGAAVGVSRALKQLVRGRGRHSGRVQGYRRCRYAGCQALEDLVGASAVRGRKKQCGTLLVLQVHGPRGEDQSPGAGSQRSKLNPSRPRHVREFQTRPSCCTKRVHLQQQRRAQMTLPDMPVR